MQMTTRGWKALAVAGVVTLSSVGVGLAPAWVGQPDPVLVPVAFPASEDRAVVVDHPARAAALSEARTTQRLAAVRASRLAERQAAKKAAELAANAKANAKRIAAREAAAVEAAAETARAEAPYDFVLSAFNILGSNHTAPGGDASGFAPGRVRTEWAVDLIAQHGSSIVGWSEIQSDQLSAVMRSTGGQFEAWPGFTLGAKGVPASMMWRTSEWRAITKKTVDIPFVGQTRPMPYVELENVATGRRIWVMSVHNAPNDRSAERNVAESRELAIVRDLVKTGLPVFFLGDMNEKAEIFCEVTGTTSLVSASGGSNDGTCRPPSGMRVDWIFGSRNAQFSEYRADRSPAVARVTDHAVIVTRVTVP
ncbi:endonuclease/exonuclease/phosphatase family protein [Nocardioides mesophilus]|uniref:Endonuclease/exonuclease/phosphatase family protein n=1 Tax=Nocardioides mesophilus TaxID=433659 RepID=A0A7G9R819_9ACTN|nr:endonuclease/exonuclease/phosphatase family protein [Nocardioides mesophilus]QNN51744.1 endonuclease/exonuclease/phosphatase family protein [Nocardioides mesophilus]